MPDGVRRIFLIEDEPVLMLELEGAIADMGWQAVPGRGSIANLLKSAQEQSFDAAVLALTWARNGLTLSPMRLLRVASRSYTRVAMDETYYRNDTAIGPLWASPTC